VETALKEAFNISRAKFLHSDGDIGKKNSTLARFTSMYFNVDFQRRKIALKPSYKLQRGFQEAFAGSSEGDYTKYIWRRSKGSGEMVIIPGTTSLENLPAAILVTTLVLYFERTHGVIALRQQWAKDS
jgi:hypothetical protein